MSTRTTSKQGRSTAKPTVKTPGKDGNKGEKQTATLLEIVPGRFNEADWTSLLENDDTEDFIADIFESIWLETSKKIEQIYIRRQLLPFTLTMIENALSNVLQWAFMPRDTPEPADGDFWMDDSEPIPCTMDNWGEGVVPACREENNQKIEDSTLSLSERRSVSAADGPTSGPSRWIERPSTGFSVHSSTQKSRSTSLTQPLLKRRKSEDIPPELLIKPAPTSTEQREAVIEEITLYPHEQRLYQHDVLVIQTHPPKLEPLSDLFFPPASRLDDTSAQSKSMATHNKRRNFLAPQASSELGSETAGSTSYFSGTTLSQAMQNQSEPRSIQNVRVEDTISKAPPAAHALLKSILSRPPAYRELELDEYGNVVSIAKIDPDKFAPRSIRVKCDIIKPRKVNIEQRPVLPAKQSRSSRTDRSDNKSTSYKLVLPEHSTDVGDLIQPVPGVLYEDSRLKKGDPRRYQTGLSKYALFHDAHRSLKPVNLRNNLSIVKMASDEFQLSQTNTDLPDGNEDKEDSGGESKLPKMHRLPRIPPITSGSATSSA